MATENERKDVALCFQALGIEFGAEPEAVEKAYQELLDVIKKKQSSADPAKRAEAVTDLELAHDLYDKIRASVTYNSRLKDMDHAASLKEDVKKKKAEQQFRICPACKKPIGIALKKCPFCREPIRTPLEALMHKLFSGKALAVIIILLLITIAAVIVTTNPELLPFMNKKPAVEVQESSSILSNISGAVKP